jgi:hypothetical protein
MLLLEVVVTNGLRSSADDLVFSCSTGRAASSVVGASLNSLFGITREAISGGVVTSIFVGNYVYVYTVYEDDFSSSIDNLQIIALTPAPPAPVAMVMP